VISLLLHLNKLVVISLHCWRDDGKMGGSKMSERESYAAGGIRLLIS
jgi:hypothetical protein